MDARKPFPDILHAILLAVILFSVQVFLGIFVTVFALILNVHEFVTNPGVMGVSIFVSFSVVLILAIIWMKEPWRKVFVFRAFRMYILAPLFVFFLGLSIIVSEADNILRFFMPVPLFLKHFLADLTAPGISSFITIVVIGPLMEELFFRGVILRGFLKQYPVKKSILVSAIIFTLYHMNPYQFFVAFILGLIFGWIYAKTKSVWLCFISHALYNSFVLLAQLLTVSIPGYTSDFLDSDSMHFQPLWFNLAGFVLIAVGLWGILKTLPITFSLPEKAPGSSLGNQDNFPRD